VLIEHLSNPEIILKNHWVYGVLHKDLKTPNIPTCRRMNSVDQRGFYFMKKFQLVYFVNASAKTYTVNSIKYRAAVVM
jgi:hypothetical protein